LTAVSSRQPRRALRVAGTWHHERTRSVNRFLLVLYRRLGFTGILISIALARFRGLPKGTYEIKVEARGFKTTQQTVTVKKTTQVQVKLQIAGIAQTVEVSGTTLGVIETVGVLIPIENPLPPVPISAGRAAPLR